MSKAEKRVPGVEMVLLSSSLMVVRLAVWVAGSGKIETVAASTIAYAVGFGFGRANGGLLFAISDLASGGDLRERDEKNRVGSSNTLGGWSIFSNALSQSAKIVGHAVKPQ